MVSPETEAFLLVVPASLSIGTNLCRRLLYYVEKCTVSPWSDSCRKEPGPGRIIRTVMYTVQYCSVQYTSTVQYCTAEKHETKVWPQTVQCTVLYCTTEQRKYSTSDCTVRTI